MADIHTVENQAGDVFVGFDADGTFIPFASVAAHRIKQLQDRADDLTARLEDDDEQAKIAVDSLPISHKVPAKSAGGKGGAS